MQNNNGLDRPRKDSDDRLARMRAINEELAGEEFAVSAKSGHVRVTVDGQGMLVDLRIADEVLTIRKLDLDTLNVDIHEAISGARQLAAERACQLLHPVFPALFSEGC
jgi:DNA-binding protein YbaB